MLVGVSRLLVLSALGALWVFGGSAAEARDFHPCVPDASWAAHPKLSARPGGSHGLTPGELGLIVYDSNQGICWLADANLAGQPEVRAAVPLSRLNPDGSLPVIYPDGTMDGETGLNWVNALDSYDNGRGWLNHSNWQLPSNPSTDLSCSAFNNANFGAQCTGSALGNLYNVGLAHRYPDSVVPRFLSSPQVTSGSNGHSAWDPSGFCSRAFTGLVYGPAAPPAMVRVISIKAQQEASSGALTSMTDSRGLICRTSSFT